MEQATGLERKELEALMEGKEVQAWAKTLIDAHQPTSSIAAHLHVVPPYPFPFLLFPSLPPLPFTLILFLSPPALL